MILERHDFQRKRRVNRLKLVIVVPVINNRTIRKRFRKYNRFSLGKDKPKPNFMDIIKQPSLLWVQLLKIFSNKNGVVIIFAGVILHLLFPVQQQRTRFLREPFNNPGITAFI